LINASVKNASNEAKRFANILVLAGPGLLQWYIALTDFGNALWCSLEIDRWKGMKSHSMFTALVYRWKMLKSIHLLWFEFPAKTTWWQWILWWESHPVMKVLIGNTT